MIELSDGSDGIEYDAIKAAMEVTSPSTNQHRHISQQSKAKPAIAPSKAKSNDLFTQRKPSNYGDYFNSNRDKIIRPTTSTAASVQGLNRLKNATMKLANGKPLYQTPTPTTANNY